MRACCRLEQLRPKLECSAYLAIYGNQPQVADIEGDEDVEGDAEEAVEEAVDEEPTLEDE